MQVGFAMEGRWSSCRVVDTCLATHPRPLARVLQPDAGRLVVVEIDRDREPLGVQPEPFLAGQELPGPVDGLALEVVAEAEVAQHLEERVVVGRAADVVDVAGAEALLAGRGPGELELAAAEEVVLELVHAGGREQHRGIPARHQHVAGPADAAFGLEEGEVLFAEFVGFHGLTVAGTRVVRVRHAELLSSRRRMPGCRSRIPHHIRRGGW